MPSIDTVTLTLPMDEALWNFISSNSDKLQRLCGSGEVIWCREWVQSSLPSSFAGLRMMPSWAADKLANGIRNAKDIVIFEFSLAKWASPYGYNHKNTDFGDDIEHLRRWVREFNAYTGFRYSYNAWNVTRCDVSEVYKLYGGTTDAFLDQGQIKMSRYTDATVKQHKYDGTLYYPSTWIAKKIYDKYKEWRRNERSKYKDLIRWGYLESGEAAKGEEMKIVNLKKNHSEQLKKARQEFIEKYGKEPMPAQEIEDLKNCLRLEIEYRRDFLTANKITGIEDLIQLRDRFEQESVKWLSIRNLSEDLSTLDAKEYFLIDRCKRVGFKLARLEFLAKWSKATFYRVKGLLEEKNIFPEYLENKDFRGEINDVDDNISKFELRLAA